MLIVLLLEKYSIRNRPNFLIGFIKVITKMSLKNHIKITALKSFAYFKLIKIILLLN